MFVISVYALFFILIMQVNLKQFVTDDDEVFLENG